MNADEIERTLEAIEQLQEVCLETIPLDDETPPDSAFEMGFVMGKLADLAFLLKRDQRAKGAQQP